MIVCVSASEKGTRIDVELQEAIQALRCARMIRSRHETIYHLSVKGKLLLSKKHFASESSNHSSELLRAVARPHKEPHEAFWMQRSEEKRKHRGIGSDRALGITDFSSEKLSPENSKQRLLILRAI